MSQIKYDFQVVGPVDGSLPRQAPATTQKGAVASGTTSSISPGDLVVYANGYWAKVADGGAASAGLYGVAASTSTETAAADGTVTVFYHESGLEVQGTPATPGNLAQAILGDLVSVDVDGSGNQTVDENASGILRVVGYDDTSGAETINVIVPYNTTPA